MSSQLSTKEKLLYIIDDIELISKYVSLSNNLCQISHELYLGDLLILCVSNTGN